MRRVIDVINEAIKGKDVICRPCDRINLDYERYIRAEEENEHKALGVFENPAPEKDHISSASIPWDVPSILKYFLDGSRKTYKVADLQVKGRYLPLIAGQVAVGVLQRDQSTNSLKPMRELCKVECVIAFPDEVTNEEDIGQITEYLSREVRVCFRLLRYTVKEDRDPVDLGIAKIMSHMHDMELTAVHELSERGLLNGDSILLKDGPLRYKNIKGRGFDVTQFRNVIGVSKRFRPSFTLGSGRKKVDVGVITASLEISERTPVFKTDEEDRYIGMWYLRIRPRDKMPTPLSGIIKIECYAIDPQEEEQGLDSERISHFSSHLLRERNVTPYGSDMRWATHLYPIYQTESYIKTSMLSNVRFEGLF
jgi:hypothetical protein